MKRLHPITQLLYFITLIYITSSFQGIRVLGVAIFISILCLSTQKLFLSAIKTIFYFIPFMLFIVVITVFINSTGNHVFLYFNNRPLTFESVKLGLESSLRILTLLLYFLYINTILDTHKILYLFGLFLPRFSLMLSIILSYIPLFHKRNTEISEVSQTYSSQSKLKRGISNLSTLMSSSLEASIDTSYSMTNRGFSSRKKYKAYSHYIYTTKNIVFTAFTVFILTISFIYKASYPSLIICTFPIIIELYSQIYEKLYFTTNKRRLDKHEQ